MEVFKWNCANITKPATASCSYNCSEVKKLGNLKEIADVLNGITSTVRENHCFSIEVQCLDRMIYRIATVHKNDKQLQSLRKVKKCLSRAQDLKLDEIAEQLYLEMKRTFQSSTSASSSAMVYLPTRQMFEYLMIRIQGMSKLLLQTLHYCYDSCRQTLQKIYLGHFINVNLILVSAISRLWFLLRLLVLQCIEWYQKLLNFVTSLKGTNAEWLTPEDSLPANLETWLGPDWKKFCQYENLQTNLDEVQQGHS